MAVSAIHESGYIHCDLKPENILLESTHKFIKVIDFGMCRNKDNHKCDANSIGTKKYQPPEVKNGWVVLASDIWVCGAILLKMITGKDPACFKLDKGSYSMDSDLACLLSREVKDLMAKLVNPNPNLRPTAKEALQHSWFIKEK